jgi:hypothetical protein
MRVNQVSRRSCPEAPGPSAPRAPREHHCAAGQRRKWRASRPVGRVLCTRGCGPAAIHLGLPLPTASCGLPASIGRAVLKRSRRKRKIAGRFPLGLAPGGVYQAARVTPGAGGLLHHRFTLTSPAGQGPDHGRRSVFCGTVPRVTPGRCYRPPCPAEPGPSSPRVARRGRPADSLATARVFSRVPPGCHKRTGQRPFPAPKGDPRAEADLYPMTVSELLAGLYGLVGFAGAAGLCGVSSG